MQPLRCELLAETGFVGERNQPGQQALRVVQQLGAQRLHQHAGQLGVGLIEPAAEGDAVGLVVDPLGVQLVQLGKDRAFHQLAVQRRYAIDAVRAQERQVAHAHPPAVVFFDQGHGTQQVEIMHAFGTQRIEMVGIDQVDDLHVPGQHALHQGHRPGFQGLGQQGVVGVGQGAHGHFPGGVPGDLMFVDQQPHQLGHGDGGVGVVELDSRRIGQVEQVIVHVQVPTQQVLQRCRHEEVLLAQAQLLASLGTVGRVQYAGDAFGARHLGNGAQVVPCVEALQVQFLQRPCTPQAQGIDAGASPANDRRVVRHRPDGFAGRPHLALVAMRVADRFDAATKTDGVDDFGPLEFPRVAEIQPVFRLFLLPTVHHGLPEQPVLVADTVTMRGNAQR